MKYTYHIIETLILLLLLLLLRANDVLISKWRERCCIGKLQASYFLVDHPTENLRPMPIDLAILYCSKDVIRTLLLCGADINHRYYLSFIYIILL